jgi:carotenoid cleavage dioxygenase-like enzyme
MEIQVATLCDSAADYNGKLCILGSFDSIMAHALPAIHPQCSIALRIVFRREDEGHHELRVNIVDEDGQLIVPPLQTIIDIVMPDDLLFLSRNLVLNLQQLKFERQGLYSVDVTVDNELRASMPLQVAVMQRPAQG